MPFTFCGNAATVLKFDDVLLVTNSAHLPASRITHVEQWRRASIG
jgi:hypothetical protein